MSLTVLASSASTTAVNTVSNWWEDEQIRSWVVERPVKIVIILLIAVIAQWVLRRIINQLAAKASKTPSGATIPRLTLGPKATKAQREEESRQQAAMNRSQENRRKSRIKTLAGVSKSAVGIIIWSLAALLILDQLGVNIAPLIASAGVVGVALGFGAQSLVKDFLSGIFMLLEDQYGIGDTIDVGEEIIGDVEDITLRVTKLRDIDGTLWTVRNGEILRIGNFSDHYAICRLQIPVGLSNNAKEAWRVIEDAVNHAVKDPEIVNEVIDEPVINGISDWEPDYISYRISIKTMPGQQWHVQRHAQAHILDAMQEAGISTPYPYGMGIMRKAD
ncbi:mechanosensitive ion channel family protein [Corynebacterium sp. HMSC04H06]|uniref:mechanosensitive ion channel family protein n=1 Tax=Corynebacterium sp. HMSC04H06 TaxID=1581050 RepID=UPI0008A4DFD4|nr:mechanosensitive ion channel family protein [Corynebacterium sp. HMSC04H06]OFS20602.1 mechanosensitive ion channel protein MscS [Corynebacterium sp. HMSC04H06]